MATTEYRRFTLNEYDAGRTEGWRFVAGWFCVPGGAGPWGWYVREVKADE